MSPHKGVHDLVDAFARIAPRRPDVELQLIGPPGAYPLEETYAPGDPRLPTLRPFYAGDYTAALRRRVPPELTTRVRFPGPVPTEDVPARVAGADVFCLPSVWDEGFGLPALEAGAAAVPVVATRAGGLPEVVVHGRTGLLVPQSDPAALAEALARLLDDPPFGRELGRAAAARARDRVSWTVQAETLWERYMAASRRRDAATGSGPRRGTVRLA
jgi:glycosyltransferase involved in cell wall biosynthesis